MTRLLRFVFLNSSSFVPCNEMIDGRLSGYLLVRDSFDLVWFGTVWWRFSIIFRVVRLLLLLLLIWAMHPFPYEYL